MVLTDGDIDGGYFKVHHSLLALSHSPNTCTTGSTTHFPPSARKSPKYNHLHIYCTVYHIEKQTEYSQSVSLFHAHTRTHAHKGSSQMLR